MTDAKKSLDALAIEHKQKRTEFMVPAGQPVPEHGSPYFWEHQVADRLHGWSEHNYHYAAEPVMLTSEEYQGALKAAREGLKPYEPALAESRDMPDAAEPTHLHGLPLKVDKDGREIKEESAQ